MTDVEHVCLFELGRKIFSIWIPFYIYDFPSIFWMELTGGRAQARRLCEEKFIKELRRGQDPFSVPSSASLWRTIESKIIPRNKSNNVWPRQELGNIDVELPRIVPYHTYNKGYGMEWCLHGSIPTSKVRRMIVERPSCLLRVIDGICMIGIYSVS